MPPVPCPLEARSWVFYSIRHLPWRTRSLPDSTRGSKAATYEGVRAEPSGLGQTPPAQNTCRIGGKIRAHRRASSNVLLELSRSGRHAHQAGHEGNVRRMNSEPPQLPAALEGPGGLRPVEVAVPRMKNSFAGVRRGGWMAASLAAALAVGCSGGGGATDAIDASPGSQSGSPAPSSGSSGSASGASPGGPSGASSGAAGSGSGASGSSSGASSGVSASGTSSGGGGASGASSGSVTDSGALVTDAGAPSLDASWGPAVDGGPSFSGPMVPGTVTVMRGTTMGRLGPGFAGFSYEKSHMTDGFFTGFQHGAHRALQSPWSWGHAHQRQ